MNQAPERAVANLRAVTEALALQPDDQLAYLERLGVGGVVDELASQFDDLFQLTPALSGRGAISAQAVHALRDIDRLLETMSGDDSAFWTEEALVSAGEWETVRGLARRALALLPTSEAPAEG